MNKFLIGIVFLFIANSIFGQSVLNPDEVRVRRNFTLPTDTTLKKYQWELKAYAGADTGLLMRVRTTAGVQYWLVGKKPEVLTIRPATGLTVTRKKMSNVDSLVIDGTFTGTPGGSNTQVQFNNLGAFSGSSDFIWNNATKVLGVNGNVALTGTGRFSQSSADSTARPGGGFFYREGSTGTLKVTQDPIKRIYPGAGSGLTVTHSNDSTIIGGNTVLVEQPDATGRGNNLYRTPNDTTLRFRAIQFTGTVDTSSSTTDTIKVNVLSGAGEANTASNVGATGASVFKQKTGVDFEFRKIGQGANITVTQSADSITISTSGAVGEANTTSNSGAGLGLAQAKSGVNLPFKSLTFPGPVTGTSNTNDVAINWGPTATVDNNGQALVNAIMSVNAQTGTTYTLQSSDNGKIITLSNASAITVTVPSTLPTGFNCTLIQLGAGQVGLTTSGVTIQNRNSHTKLAGQYSMATLVEYTSNVLVFQGDTSN